MALTSKASPNPARGAVPALLGTIVLLAAALEPAHARSASPQRGNACPFILRLRPEQCTTFMHRRAENHRHRASWLSAAARTGTDLVYATLPFEDAVDIASAGPHGLVPVGQLALGSNSFPIGLTVAPSRDLYVTITALLGSPAVPSVEVFKPGDTQPSKTYTKGLTGPVDVAVDRHGTVYVANQADIKGGGCDTQSGGANVVEYARGSSKPTAIIDDFPGCVWGVAVDASANLYLTYYYYPNQGVVQSDVVKYAFGSTKGTRLNLSAPGGNFFGGLAIRPSGDVVVSNVLDDATLMQILTFPAGSTAPSGTIEYGGLDGWSSEYFALRDNRIFAPAYIAQDVGSVMAEFAYPSGKQLFVQDPTVVAPAFVYGFAVSPAS